MSDRAFQGHSERAITSRCTSRVTILGIGNFLRDLIRHSQSVTYFYEEASFNTTKLNSPVTHARLFSPSVSVFPLLASHLLQAVSQRRLHRLHRGTTGRLPGAPPRLHWAPTAGRAAAPPPRS